MDPKQKAYAEKIVNECMQEFQRLSGGRGNWESHWQEIAERMMPMHSRSFQNPQGSANQTQGEKRNEKIFDPTAQIALGRFSAIMDSILTPRNQIWHRLKSTDVELNKNREVQLYFENVNRVLFQFRYSPRANYASQNQQQYTSLGAYGTGSLFIDKLAGAGERGLRYRNIHLSEIYFDENHQGIIDRATRYFPLKARQAVEQFGKANLPDEISAAAEGAQPDRIYFFLHCVRPRTDYDPLRKDFKGMMFGSYYISITGNHLISEGGYNTFPYATSRYMLADNEVYGRSPAMDVLPAVKTLNEQMKTMLKHGHRSVDPVLLAHDDGVLSTFNLKPGALNAGGMSKDGRPLIGTLPLGNPLWTKELMDDGRKSINDAFLVTIFQVMTETPQMTATEVIERVREKGMLLAPTAGRVQSEYLGSGIERELDVLSEEGLLPPPPAILREAGVNFRVEYDSPLSRAQRAEEAAGLMRSLQTALEVVNITQDPSPLDYFNWDVAIPQIADIQGVPASWMRGKDQVDAMRAARARQAQAQQQIQAAPAAAAMMKAQADIQKKSAG